MANDSTPRKQSAPGVHDDSRSDNLDEPNASGANEEPSVNTPGERSVGVPPSDFLKKLEALRIPTSRVALGARKLITHFAVRKPNRYEWFRVRPGVENQFAAFLLALPGDRDSVYIVHPKVAAGLQPQDVQEVLLILVVTAQGTAFLWPLRLPPPDGKSLAWHETARAAARRAEDVWIRLAANNPAGEYDVLEALGELGDPIWPDLPFEQILDIALRGRVIDDADHPVLRRLRGES
jgi:hypothetical protein